MPSSTDQQFEQSLTWDVPLAPFTTLGIGGPAKYFARITSAELLRTAIEWAGATGVGFFVLGGGSNILIADSGFPGLVLKIEMTGIDITPDKKETVIRAGAGEEWDRLVASSVSRNLSGFECLSGIPGLVGATPIQNVGAYGQDVSETLVSVDALDLTTRKTVILNPEQCEFGYRDSRFKTREPRRFIITGVTYQLVPNGKPAVRYPELADYLSGHGAVNPSLSQVREAVLSIRKRKAMVIDIADPDSRSVGSFFVNPVVGPARCEEIRDRAARLSPLKQPMPAFPTSDGRVKLSAAWLIERAGFCRGWVHGNVGISSKHALAIINRGGGTAREVIELADLIVGRVRDRFGVELVPEPVFVGCDGKQ